VDVGHFDPSLPGTLGEADETKANSVVESHYYLLLGETGWPTLVAYLLLIAGGLWRNLQAVLSFPHSFLRCLSLGIGMGCSLNDVQSLLERVLVQPRNLMLWMILFGITARLEVLRRAAPQPADPTSAGGPSGGESGSCSRWESCCC
jgi:hypothetical protein